MGFWDKVKSVTDKVTGKGAKVAIIMPNEALELGEPFTVRVTADISSNDLKVSKVYLLVDGTETVSFEEREVEYEEGHREVERERRYKSIKTFQDRMELDINEVLQANEHYEWEVELCIPEDLNGTYIGTHAKHEYAVYAGLDAPGNDPDSGWVRFEIY